MEVISIHNLYVKYDEDFVLEDVTFNIQDKEFIGIVGPNGGGKTTLMKSILKLIKPKKGNITIRKDEVIGYVPQLKTFDRTFPISVRDVILLAHLPRKLRPQIRFTKEATTHVDSIMKQLKIEHLAKRQIGALSGGQLQKVLIARSMMNHPTILILDEPTAGVDVDSKEDIYNMLQELNKNITIIMISHDMENLFKHVKRLVYINKTSTIYDKSVIKNQSIDTEQYPIDLLLYNGNKVRE